MATDAVVIGAGPNGLVAANLLADAGWSVVVLEAQPTPGGAVRSAEVTAPGFVSDLFSAFYPLGYASPVLRPMHLEAYGLRWLTAPLALAHPLEDGRCPVLSTDVEATATSLEAFAAGDGDAWRRLFEQWRRIEAPLLDALFTPFPPVLPAVRLAARLGIGEGLRMARMGLLPVRRLAAEEFRGEGGGLLLGGNALHTDLGPDSAASGVYGWLLSMLGQSVGFPVPAGGAGELTAALIRRLEAHGGSVRCNAPVARVVVRGGRAVAVRLADGTEVDAGRAVLADVDAPTLYARLVGEDLLPAPVVADLRRFDRDDATVKVDWALSGPVPWVATGPQGAGTVHLGGDLDEMSDYAHALALGRVPARPFVLFGQMTTTDPSRSPAGTESAWGYTHVPQSVRGDLGGDLTGSWDESEAERYADRIEARVEDFAPGFRDRILGRYVQSPRTLQASDANLVGGALNGGTAAIHQQLVFKPVLGRGGAGTPILGLYLASSSAHPGGGVHGAPGANAARAALRSARPAGRLVRGAAGPASRLLRGAAGPAGRLVRRAAGPVPR